MLRANPTNDHCKNSPPTTAFAGVSFSRRRGFASSSSVSSADVDDPAPLLRPPPPAHLPDTVLRAQSSKNSSSSSGSAFSSRRSRQSFAAAAARGVRPAVLLLNPVNHVPRRAVAASVSASASTSDVALPLLSLTPPDGPPRHLQTSVPSPTFPVPLMFVELAEPRRAIAADDGMTESPRAVPSAHSSRRLPTSASYPSAVNLAAVNSADRPPATAATTTAASTTADGGATADELAWGPEHPCYPHLNPHVPMSSAAYLHTRVVRIRRDWMVAGDLAPTFSNLYPEILDSVLPEPEFRALVARVNAAVLAAYNPFSAHNWLDATLGLLTGWLWDDLGFTHAKRALAALERWLIEWNEKIGATTGVRVVSLRRTGYMSMDIQIPDPKIGVLPESRPQTAT